MEDNLISFKDLGLSEQMLMVEHHCSADDDQCDLFFQ